jgi:hypothetical protein
MTGINSEDHAFAAWSRVINSIAAERHLQDLQWGGPANDDLRDVDDWLQYIALQGRKMAEDIMQCTEWTEAQKVSRQRFIKIAALCVAAVQSLDRKEAGNASQP